jgi:hypothetical protein
VLPVTVENPEASKRVLLPANQLQLNYKWDGGTDVAFSFSLQGNGNAIKDKAKA